jgi:hypothetical protein
LEIMEERGTGQANYLRDISLEEEQEEVAERRRGVVVGGRG